MSVLQNQLTTIFEILKEKASVEDSLQSLKINSPDKSSNLSFSINDNTVDLELSHDDLMFKIIYNSNTLLSFLENSASFEVNDVFMKNNISNNIYADYITSKENSDELTIESKVINFGSPYGKINFIGTTTFLETQEIASRDKLFGINLAPEPGSTDAIDMGQESGIIIHSNISDGYIRTNSAANSFLIKAPLQANEGKILYSDLDDNIDVIGNLNIQTNIVANEITGIKKIIIDDLRVDDNLIINALTNFIKPINIRSDNIENNLVDGSIFYNNTSKNIQYNSNNKLYTLLSTDSSNNGDVFDNNVTFNSVLYSSNMIRAKHILPISSDLDDIDNIDQHINIFGNVINIGTNDSHVIIRGITSYIETTNLKVNDKIITLNIQTEIEGVPQIPDYGANCGIEIVGTNNIIGYIKTNHDATKFIFKAPLADTYKQIAPLELDNSFMMTNKATFKTDVNILNLHVTNDTDLRGTNITLESNNININGIMKNNNVIDNRLNSTIENNGTIRNNNIFNSTGLISSTGNVNLDKCNVTNLIGENVKFISSETDSFTVNNLFELHESCNSILRGKIEVDANITINELVTISTYSSNATFVTSLFEGVATFQNEVNIDNTVLRLNSSELLGDFTVSNKLHVVEINSNIINSDSILSTINELESITSTSITSDEIASNTVTTVKYNDDDGNEIENDLDITGKVLNILSDTINIGNSQSIINILGTTYYSFVSQVIIKDNIITVNGEKDINGNKKPVDNGFNCGIEILGTNGNGHIITNTTGDKYYIKAPLSPKQDYIATLDSLTSNFTLASNFSVTGSCYFQGTVNFYTQTNFFCDITLYNINDTDLNNKENIQDGSILFNSDSNNILVYHSNKWNSIITASLDGTSGDFVSDDLNASSITVKSSLMLTDTAIFTSHRINVIGTAVTNDLIVKNDADIKKIVSENIQSDIIIAKNNLQVNTITSRENETLMTIDADIINIGRPGSEVRILGDQTQVLVNELNVYDKYIYLNINEENNGGIDEGSLSGIEILGLNNNNGFIRTSADAARFEIKAPKDTTARYVATLSLNNNDLEVSGNTTLHTNLDVIGDIKCIGDNVILNSNNVDIGPFKYINNAALITGNSVVVNGQVLFITTSETIIIGVIQLDGTNSFNGTNTMNDVTLIQGDNTVSGTTIMQGTTNINENVFITGLNVINGNTEINNVIAMNGNISIDGTTTIIGDVDINAMNIVISNTSVNINSDISFNNKTDINDNTITTDKTVTFNNKLTDFTKTARFYNEIVFDNLSEYMSNQEAVDNGVPLWGLYRTGGIIKIRLDAVLPTLTLIGSPNIKLDKNIQYIELGASSLDNLDNDILVSIVSIHSDIVGEVLSFPILLDSLNIIITDIDYSISTNYIITYRTEDSSGNYVNNYRNLYIRDDARPIKLIIDNINQYFYANGRNNSFSNGRMLNGILNVFGLSPLARNNINFGYKTIENNTDVVNDKWKFIFKVHINGPINRPILGFAIDTDQLRQDNGKYRLQIGDTFSNTIVSYQDINGINTSFTIDTPILESLVNELTIELVYESPLMKLVFIDQSNNILLTINFPEDIAVITPSVNYYPFSIYTEGASFVFTSDIVYQINF